MKKEVDKYIPAALEAVREVLAHNKADQHMVFEEYNGYAASLGAAIVTADFQAAIAFYSDSSKEKQTDVGKKPFRYYVLRAIAKVLSDNGVEDIDTAAKDGLLAYIVGLEKSQRKQVRRQVIRASVALKLALRSFDHVKSAAK